MVNKSGIDRTIELLSADLTIIGVGTGSAPAYTATQLTNSILRKPITTTAVDVNVLIKEIMIETSEANTTLTEIGIFGDGATTTAGTGALFGSTAANIVKNNTQSLTISFEIEIKEVP